MVLIKIVPKEAKFRRFKITNFLYVVEDNKLQCSKCKEPIENDNYCYICSDLNKVWHELCMDNYHTKTTFKIFGNIKQHTDMLCLIKYMPVEHFNEFETKAIELKL